MPEVKVLFSVLEEYMKENTFDEAILAYYEHHYIWKHGDDDDLEHFFNQYYIDNDVEHLRDMAHFILMDAYRKQLEELEVTLYDIHKLLALSEEEFEVDHILSQYEETQQARRVLGPKLEALHNKIVARQKELEEAAKTRPEQPEEDPPVVEVPRLSTRQRLVKAIKTTFRRIWRSTRRRLPSFLPHLRHPPAP
ncbi:hypothetical protein XENTR_v10005085 [Xenopus tropicalis]|nr:hypothetical protein XENTR_v10005085 [Xenopus tropicalis]